MILVFIIGYLLLITADYLTFLNKSILSILMATCLWGIIFYFQIPVFQLENNLITWNTPNNLLLFHIGKISEIVFFLIGAMSIICIIDIYSGFDALKNLLFSNTTKRNFLWIINFLSFFLSAIIDNLTATIVIITLLRKIILDDKERLYYLGSIIISANAGGVWSPIGDITTTMLWISNKVTTYNIIQTIFVPSILCMSISTLIISRYSIFDGELKIKNNNFSKKELKSGIIVFQIGLLMMLIVPILKTLIGIPPYMGIMFTFSLFYTLLNIPKQRISIKTIFNKIDFASILFFLGILLSISSLESIGVLYQLSNWINHSIVAWKQTTLLFGLISSIIDNVPLVASTISMFSYPLNHEFWNFIAYTSGTGGSLLLIGSASGVAAMGMEKINFFWYLKSISYLALIGYISGFLYMLI
ncbi:sodium:proton antiporter NhaD [Blattabacterium cuenoti]|uniref:sodium:proton antiporter NhaD n=1 Tax=Blattabacterium cuenoti TaxID=1653831 RepID=UPI001EEBFCDE|nr:sodium:proton antiporter NhaD [Blattabacterium cuenoti]